MSYMKNSKKNKKFKFLLHKQDKTIIKKVLEISEINKNTIEQNIEIKIDNFKKVIN